MIKNVHDDYGVGLRSLVRGRYDKWIGLTKPSDQPYQSHVPVLTELAGLLKPRRVAEFGMGNYSTSVFLDRNLFPSVERLSSFENDREWFANIQQKHHNDSRFDPHFVTSPMWKAAITLRADEFDLVFVDDSSRANERVKTILALRLARGITCGPLVVVHDVDQPRYRAATLLFPKRRYFRASSPQTGALCWPSGLEH
jgi:predicted O-methyltransferase YrrM